MNNLKAVVYGRIDKLAASEKITLVELRELSRELLMYVPDTGDIDCVNRLIVVLSPMNKKGMIYFVKFFLPWQQEKDNDGNHVRFGKKIEGEKQLAKKQTEREQFLADPKNNFWTFTKDMVKEPVDLGAGVKRAVKKALEGDDRGSKTLTPEEILSAVFDGGVSLDQFLEIMQDVKEMVDNAKEQHAKVEFKHAA